MRIDWATFLFQTVNLLVLIALLSRFLFRPVAALIAERRAAAARLIVDATQQLKAAEQTRLALDHEAANLADRRAEALRSSTLAAEGERRRLMEAAEAAAAQVVAQAHSAAEQERKADAKAAGREAAELALDIAGKLLERLPAAALSPAFLDGLIMEIGGLGAAARAELAAGPLTLAAPAELDGAQRAKCQEALSRALGREVTPAFSVDPKLIAGLRLEAPHMRVENHLRRDLDAIAQEFFDHAA